MPVQFEIRQGDEDIISHSGLALVGKLLSQCQLEKFCDHLDQKGSRTKEYPTRDLVKTMAGLISVGKPDFDAAELNRHHPAFAQLLGIAKCPSAPTLRQRLQEMGATLHPFLRGRIVDLLIQTKARIGTTHSVRHGELIPAELDVVVFDNSKTQKEGVAPTYQRNFGFAPIFAHVGTQGYLVNAELRTGSNHSQGGTPDFLRQTLTYIKTIVDLTRLLWRLDSGFDSQENIDLFESEGSFYIISYNLRKEDPGEWLKLAENSGEKLKKTRSGKSVYVGETFREVAGKTQRIVYEVTERTSVREKGGYQDLLVPEIEVRAFRTNLRDRPQDVIQLYRDRGTSEQFHSELKGDLNLERLPSNKFDANETVLLIGALVYNILRRIGQEAIRRDPHIPKGQRAPIRKLIFRRRLQSVMNDLIYMAAKVVKSGRRYSLIFGRHCPWFEVWKRVYLHFSQVSTA